MEIAEAVAVAVEVVETKTDKLAGVPMVLKLQPSQKRPYLKKRKLS